VIDLHCHILPGVDDGPQTMAGTLEMARAHVDAGVRRVAATPHVSWDMPTRAVAVSEGVAAVNAALAGAAIDLEVVTGGEVALTRVMDLDDEELNGLRLGGGPWLLLEAPLSSAAAGIDLVVDQLQVRGHKVLLAHPERCPAFHRAPERLAELVAGGALTSITAGALVGRFGSTVARFAHRLAHAGLIHSVASDAHDTRRRPPGLRREVEEAGYREHVDWWCTHVPAAILACDPIPPGPPPPEPPRRRGLADVLRLLR
jgi:protein-tyrosine phosphatase